MPGKNLAPLFTEPDKEINTAIFAEKSWHDFDDHARAVRTSRWKYIRYSYTDIPLTPPGDAVRSATFQAMRSLRDAGQLTADQQRCFVTPRPAEELFDLTADPHELHNLATDPAHAATLEAHRAELDRWIVATDDRVPTQRQPDKYDREFGKPLQPR
jgi:arylsulfatase A-like enzyme